MSTNLDIAPAEHSIDWSGTRPAPDLDAATTASRDALYAAIDGRLEAMPGDVPTTTPQPDHTTDEVVAIGTTALEATDDLGAAAALLHVLGHVADLSERLQAARAITSTSLAMQHRHVRRAAVEREARHVG